LDLHRRSRALKARNFPRYATSARNRSFSRRSRSSSDSSAGGGESGFRGLPLGLGRNASAPSRRYARTHFCNSSREDKPASTARSGPVSPARNRSTRASLNSKEYDFAG